MSGMGRLRMAQCLYKAIIDLTFEQVSVEHDVPGT